MLEIRKYERSCYSSTKTPVVDIETDEVGLLACIKKYLDNKMHAAAALNNYEETINVAQSCADLIKVWNEVCGEGEKNEGLDLPCITRE